VVAMTVLMGYYSTVSMTHIAHNLPLRADQRPLPPLARALPTALR